MNKVYLMYSTTYTNCGESSTDKVLGLYTTLKCAQISLAHKFCEAMGDWSNPKYESFDFLPSQEKSTFYNIDKWATMNLTDPDFTFPFYSFTCWNGIRSLTSDIINIHIEERPVYE